MSSQSTARRIEGKVALITGAGSGIGRAAAVRFAEEGANLVLLDRDRQTLAVVCREAEAFGAKSIAVEADISDEHSLAEAYDKAISAFGQLDIVFANAGINGTISPIEHMSKEEWEATINVNLNGTFLTVKHAIPLLKEKGGSIIITSSINGNRVFSNFGFSAYSSSKAGETAFTRMAALELAEYGIRVNAICPGAISTNIDQSTKPSQSSKRFGSGFYGNMPKLNTANPDAKKYLIETAVNWMKETGIDGWTARSISRFG